MKKETRGRKPTGGRVRKRILSARFTEEEQERINSGAKDLELTQHEFIINSTEFYLANENRKHKPKGEGE